LFKKKVEYVCEIMEDDSHKHKMEKWWVYSIRIYCEEKM